MVEGLRQFESRAEVSFDLGCCPAAQHHPSRSKQRAQSELSGVARDANGQGAKCFHAFVEMRDRLVQCHALQSQLACFEPIVDCFIRKAGCVVVISEQFRLGNFGLRKVLFQRDGNLGMYLDAACFEQ
jgi:hypothetical protein